MQSKCNASRKFNIGIQCDAYDNRLVRIDNRDPNTSQQHMFAIAVDTNADVHESFLAQWLRKIIRRDLRART